MSFSRHILLSSFFICSAFSFTSLPVRFTRSSIQTKLNAEEDRPVTSSRRNVLNYFITSSSTSLFFPFQAYAVTTRTRNFPDLDVNNSLAREFTAFPGLYPTIATKIVNAGKIKPYTSKKDVYAILDSDAERERLQIYDSNIRIAKPDAAIKQFKSSQICKYECGNRASSSYRDDQIRQVQAGR